MHRGYRYGEFGGKVKAWRKAMWPPVTQKDLGKKVGVSDGFVAHVECGMTMPGVRTMKAMAGALGVREEEVLQAAGYLSERQPSDGELIGDPELRLFFQDDWPGLSEDERDWFKCFVRIMKMRRKN